MPLLQVSLFIRNDNLVMTPIWRLQNGQGPSWKYAQAQIDAKEDYQVSFLHVYNLLCTMLSSLQVVVEGVWGNNRVSGFIAVDDVTFFEGECSSQPITILRSVNLHL